MKTEITVAARLDFPGCQKRLSDRVNRRHSFDRDKEAGKRSRQVGEVTCPSQTAIRLHQRGIHCWKHDMTEVPDQSDAGCLSRKSYAPTPRIICTAGNSIPIRMPMMAITTSSSIRVKPWCTVRARFERKRRTLGATIWVCIKAFRCAIRSSLAKRITLTQAGRYSTSGIVFAFSP